MWNYSCSECQGSNCPACGWLIGKRGALSLSQRPTVFLQADASLGENTETYRDDSQPSFTLGSWDGVTGACPAHNDIIMDISLGEIASHMLGLNSYPTMKAIMTHIERDSGETDVICCLSLYRFGLRRGVSLLKGK